MQKSRNCSYEVYSQRVIIGAAMLSPRLTDLDRERQLSMADEGGFSAAILEGEELSMPNHSPPEKSTDLSSLVSWIGDKTFLKNEKVLLTSTVLAVGLGYYLLKQKRLQNA